MLKKEDVKDILEKYRSKLGEHIDIESEGQVGSESSKAFSREYLLFREEVLSKQRTRYERWCSTAENIIKLKPSTKLLPQIEDSIRTAHISITPSCASSFAALASLFLILSGALISVLFYLIFETFLFLHY